MEDDGGSGTPIVDAFYSPGGLWRVQSRICLWDPLSHDFLVALIGKYGCAVSNAGVEDDGGSGTPVMDPFYTPGAYGGSSPGSTYGMSTVLAMNHFHS